MGNMNIFHIGKELSGCVQDPESFTEKPLRFLVDFYNFFGVLTDSFGVPMVAKVENFIHCTGISGIKDMVTGGSSDYGFQCRNDNGVIRLRVKGAMLILQIITLLSKSLSNGTDERRFSRPWSTFDNNNTCSFKPG